jgi:hypothetical protein
MSRAAVAHSVTLGLGSAVAIPSALIVLGSVARAIPIVGLIGSLLSGFAGWLGTFFAVATGMTIPLFIRRPTLWRAAMVADILISPRPVATAKRYGVTINPIGSRAEKVPAGQRTWRSTPATVRTPG